VHALGERAGELQVRRLKRVLNGKSVAAYSGDYYTLEDGRDVFQDVKRYATWAEEMLAARP